MKIIVWMCLTPFFCAACSNSKVTGQSSPTSDGTQSETSATTSYSGGVSRIVVAYNDETNEQGLIVYTQNSRVINRGASLMGWSYSNNAGADWVYGGKVSPPANWAALWGDPALATSGANSNVVFMGNLAMPNSKFPAGGVQGPVNYGDGRTAYAGGACIAKSTDGGQHFASYQCISNTQAVAAVPDSGQGHFYDGGHLVSNSAGEIYAAYIDMVTNLIDVYRSPDANGSFQPIATPFPGLTATSHALLRSAPDNSIYVAAQVLGTDYNYYVYLNRYANGAWGTPVRASNPSQLYPTVDFGTTVQGYELSVRTGPQFGYDVGSASPGGADAIRLLYTQRAPNGHLSLGATACSADLSSCSNVPGWGFQGSGPGGAAVDTYNPDVAAWRGFIGYPATWQSSWNYHYGNTNFINVSRTTLGYVNSTPGIFPIDILSNAPVCPDQRGYWGDYDAFLLTGLQNGSTNWTRFSTDSSAGCTQRWMYVGTAQHVQQTTYPF